MSRESNNRKPYLRIYCTKYKRKFLYNFLNDRIKAKSILITDVCRVYNDFTN